MEAKFVGAKYDPQLSTKEIAARVRAEIKAEVAAGRLPAVKYGVRCHNGREIEIEIGALPFDPIEPFYAACLVAEVNVYRLPVGCRTQWTPEATAVHEAVEALLKAYAFDDSDIMTDYWNVNFYPRVHFDQGWMSACLDAAVQAQREHPTFEIEVDEYRGLKSWRELAPAA